MSDGNGASALAVSDGVGAATLEQVVVGNDLSKLSPSQRLEYYSGLCRSLGLNPLTRPFQYITLNNKLTLYATRDATDQLRKGNEISLTIMAREMLGDIYVVTTRATDKNGRTDESTGAVAVANLKGETLANALMKAETKSKRRVTLSICGLGMSDETEVETIPGAARVEVDDSGHVAPHPTMSAQAAGPSTRVYSEDEMRELSKWAQGIGMDNLAFGAIKEKHGARGWLAALDRAREAGCAHVAQLITFCIDGVSPSATQEYDPFNDPAAVADAAKAVDDVETLKVFRLTPSETRKIEAAVKRMGVDLAEVAATVKEKAYKPLMRAIDPEWLPAEKATAGAA